VPNQSFSATVGAWAKKVKDAEKFIFQRSAQRLAKELTDEVTKLVYDQPPAPTYPKRTGFLRASLMASNAEMPLAILDNPGSGTHDVDWGQIQLVINGTDLGDTIYLGYTAKYGPYVSAGANGQPPKPWVELVAQRWQQIVDEVAEEVRREAGL
jgi:hypothetical protein